MTDRFTPLNEEEFEYLDDFLLECIDDDADTLDKDEGVLNISELDGLFTAIVSGPVRIPPSVWISVVWGDFEQEASSIKKLVSAAKRKIADFPLTLHGADSPASRVRRE